MSNARGRAVVDVQFWDETSTDGVQSLKTLTLQRAFEPPVSDSGYPLLALQLSGTAGTTYLRVADFTGSLDYVNASGDAISFVTAAAGFLEGLAFTADGPAKLRVLDDVGNEDILIETRDGRAAVSHGRHYLPRIDIKFDSLSGTGNYSLILWGY